MAVLWQGTLEVCQEDVSGLSYGEKLSVIIKTSDDDLNPRNVFDWNPGIKNVRLNKCPKKCLKQPSKLNKYLKKSQMVNICKDTDTPQEKWDNLGNNLPKSSVEGKEVKESGEAYVFHLIAEEDSASNINCPLVLMTMKGGIGAAFCVDDATKEITKIKDVFKLFNDKLYSNVKKYLEQQSQSNTEKQPSTSHHKDTEAFVQPSSALPSEGSLDPMPSSESLSKKDGSLNLEETPLVLNEHEPSLSTPVSSPPENLEEPLPSVAVIDEPPPLNATVSQPDYFDKPPESVVIIGEKSKEPPCDLNKDDEPPSSLVNVSQPGYLERPLQSVTVIDEPPPSVQIVSQPDYLDKPPESVMIIGEKCAPPREVNVLSSEGVCNVPNEISTTATRNIVSPASSSCSANSILSTEERSSSSKVKLKDAMSKIRQVKLFKLSQQNEAIQSGFASQQTHLQQGQNLVHQSSSNTSTGQQLIQQPFSNTSTGQHLVQSTCNNNNTGYSIQQACSNTGTEYIVQPAISNTITPANIQQPMLLRPQLPAQMQPRTITHPQGHSHQPPPNGRVTYVQHQPPLSNIRGQQTNAGFSQGQFQSQNNFQNPLNTVPPQPQQMPRMQNILPTQNATFFSTSSYHMNAINVRPQLTNTATTPGNPSIQQIRTMYRNPQPQMMGQNPQIINPQQSQFTRQRQALPTWQHPGGQTNSNPGVQRTIQPRVPVHPNMIRYMQPGVQNNSNPNIRNLQPGVQINSNPNLGRTMQPGLQTNSVLNTMRTMPTVARILSSPSMTRTVHQPMAQSNCTPSTENTSMTTSSSTEAQKKAVSSKDWIGMKTFIERTLNLSKFSPEQKHYFEAWLQIMSSNPEDNLKMGVGNQSITSDLTTFNIWSVIVGRETVDNFFKWLQDSGFSEERLILKNIIQHLTTKYIEKNTYVHDATKEMKGGSGVFVDAKTQGLEDLVVEPIIMWDYNEDRAIACISMIQRWIINEGATKRLQSSFLELLRGKHGFQSFVTVNAIPSIDVDLFKKILPHLRSGIVDEKIPLTNISPDFRKYKIIQQSHVVSTCDTGKAREFLEKLKELNSNKNDMSYKISELFTKNVTKTEFEITEKHKPGMMSLLLENIANLECAVYCGYITRIELKASLELPDDEVIAKQVQTSLHEIIKRISQENADCSIPLARQKTIKVVQDLIKKKINIEECHLQLNANQKERSILTEENISRFTDRARTKPIQSKVSAPATVNQSSTPGFVTPSPVPSSALPTSPSPVAQSPSPSPAAPSSMPSPAALSPAPSPTPVASSPSPAVPPSSSASAIQCPSPNNYITSPVSRAPISTNSAAVTVITTSSSASPIKKPLNLAENNDKAEENLKLYLYKCFSKKGSKEMEKIGDVFVDLLNEKITVDQFVNEAKLTELHMKPLFLKQMRENFPSFLHAVLIGKLKLEELHWIFKETHVVKIRTFEGEPKVFNSSRARRFLGYLKNNLSSQEIGFNPEELASIENGITNLVKRNINIEQLFWLTVWDKVKPERRLDLQNKTELHIEHLQVAMSENRTYGLPTISKEDFHSYFIKEAESVPSDFSNTTSSTNEAALSADVLPGPAVSPPPSDLSNIQILGPCTPAPHRSVSPGVGGLRVLNPSQLNSRVSDASLTAESTFSIPATLDYKLHAHFYMTVPRKLPLFNFGRQYVVIFCNNFLVFCNNKIQLPKMMEQDHKFEIERWRNDQNEEQGNILLPDVKNPQNKNPHHFVYVSNYFKFEQNILNAQNIPQSISIIKIAKFEQFYLEFEIKHNMELGINVDKDSIFPSQTKDENPLLSMLKNISGVERNLQYRRQLTGIFGVPFSNGKKYVCLIFNTHLVFIPDLSSDQRYIKINKYFLERVAFGSSIKSRYCCIVGLDFLKIMTNEALLNAEIVKADKINCLIERYAPFSVVRGDSFKSILPHSYPFTNIAPQAGIPIVERKVVCLATACLNLKGKKQNAILGYFQPFDKHENEEIIYIKMSKEELTIREMDMFIITREKFRKPIEDNYSKSSDWNTVKLELVPGQGMYRLVISPLSRAAGNHPMMRFISFKMKGSLLTALENHEDVYSSRVCLDKLFKDRSKKLITNWKPLFGDKSYSDFHQVNKALISSDMDTSLDSPPAPETGSGSALPCQSPESSPQGLTAEGSGDREAPSLTRSSSRESARPSFIGGRGQHSKRFPLTKLRDKGGSTNRSLEDPTGDIADVQNIEDVVSVSQGNFSAENVSSFISSSSQEFPMDFLSPGEAQRKKDPPISEACSPDSGPKEDHCKIIDLACASLQDLLVIPGIDNETAKTLIKERNGKQTLSDFVQSEDAFIVLLEDIQYDVGVVKCGDIVIKYGSSNVNESLLKPLERFREWKEIVTDPSEIKVLDVADCESLVHYMEMNKGETENVNGLLSALKQNVQDIQNVPDNIAKMVVDFMDKAEAEKIVLTVDGKGLTPLFWKEQGQKIPQWMEFAARHLEVKTLTLNEKFTEALQCPHTFGRGMYPDITVDQRSKTLYCHQCNKMADSFVIFQKTCLDTNHTQLDMCNEKQKIVCEKNEETGCGKVFESVTSYMMHRDGEHGFPYNLAALCSLCKNKFQFPKEYLCHGCEVSLNSKIDFSKQSQARTSIIETTQEKTVLPTETNTTQDYGDGDTNEFSLASMINQTKDRTSSKSIFDDKKDETQHTVCHQQDQLEESFASKDMETVSEMVQPQKEPEDTNVSESDKNNKSMESAYDSFGVRKTNLPSTIIAQEETSVIEPINKETGLPMEFDVHRVADDTNEIKTGKSAPTLTLSTVWTEIPQDVWEQVANAESPTKGTSTGDAWSSPAVETTLPGEICAPRPQVDASKLLVSNESTETPPVLQVQPSDQTQLNVRRSSENQYIIPESDSDQAGLLYSSSDDDPEDRPRKAVRKNNKKVNTTKSSVVKQPQSTKDKWMSSLSKGSTANDTMNTKTIGTWGTVRRKSMSDKVPDTEQLNHGDVHPDNSTESIYNILKEIPQVTESKMEVDGNKQPDRCGNCIGCIRNKNKNSCMECFYCTQLGDPSICKKRRCLKIVPSVKPVAESKPVKPNANISKGEPKRKKSKRPLFESGSSSETEDDYEHENIQHLEDLERSQPPRRRTNASILTDFQDKLYKAQAVVLNKLSTDAIRKYIPYYGEEDSNDLLGISKKIDEIELVPFPIDASYYTERDIWDATFAKFEKRPIIKRKVVFTCNLCLKEFASVNLKVAHINEVHTESFEELYERKKKQPRSFECNLCKQKFLSRDERDNHLMEAHVDFEDRGPPKKVTRKPFQGPETVEVTLSLQYDGDEAVSDSSQNTLNTVGDASQNTLNTVGDASQNTLNTVGDASRNTLNTVGDASQNTLNTVGDAAYTASHLRQKDNHVASLTQSDVLNTEVLSIFPVNENMDKNAKVSESKTTDGTEVLSIFKVSRDIKEKAENTSDFKGSNLPKNTAKKAESTSDFKGSNLPKNTAKLFPCVSCGEKFSSLTNLINHGSSAKHSIFTKKIKPSENVELPSSVRTTDDEMEALFECEECHPPQIIYKERSLKHTELHQSQMKRLKVDKVLIPDLKSKGVLQVNLIDLAYIKHYDGLKVGREIREQILQDESLISASKETLKCKVPSCDFIPADSVTLLKHIKKVHLKELSLNRV